MDGPFKEVTKLARRNSYKPMTCYGGQLSFSQASSWERSFLFFHNYLNPEKLDLPDINICSFIVLPMVISKIADMCISSTVHTVCTVSMCRRQIYGQVHKTCQNSRTVCTSLTSRCVCAFKVAPYYIVFFQQWKYPRLSLSS